MGAEDMRLICDDFKVGPEIGFGGLHMDGEKFA
jgi:hypothetical protein